MHFFQTPPELGNQYDDDRVLRGYLSRALGPELEAVAPKLRELGELAGGELYRMQLEDRLREPVLTQWDPWGRRVDRIELTPLWRVAARLAAEFGMVAVPYEGALGARSRLVAAAMTYLFHPSSDVYTCPLAMTDGAARTLLTHRHQALIDRAIPRLTSRDPAKMWTSGQWMTERTGGSDVGLSEAVARRDGDAWRISGTKWFTSATTSQMALTLARPVGNPDGGKGLALFYLEPWDEDGRSNGVTVNRLKDKLGTRKVPTAELTLDDAVAVPVAGLDGGVRAITPMLNVTRTWNAVCTASDMRRAVALARDYGRRRKAFGAALSDKALHVETLAGMQAEAEAAFHLAMLSAELLGRSEHGALGERGELLLRMVTPIAKATTGKATVGVVSEALEVFGGAGYIEDTGVPRLLRDAQVTPIWEGTTNVLSLDLLRAVGASGDGLRAWREEAAARSRGCAPDARALAEQALSGIDHATSWLGAAAAEGRDEVEAGARGALLTLGRAMALALLLEQDAHDVQRGDRRALFAARRLAAHGIDRVGAQARDEARALADG
ncbi:MAG: acyl-CoA dehydrogenase family protein [Polyangiaceae bacterium]|nr:acyl-CoA dehydrogenase family protein [Polyangiaceae bacterium]